MRKCIWSLFRCLRGLWKCYSGVEAHVAVNLVQIGILSVELFTVLLSNFVLFLLFLEKKGQGD
jgi:hypothetical protein